MIDVLSRIVRVPAAPLAAGFVSLTSPLLLSCGGLDIPAVRFSQIDEKAVNGAFESPTGPLDQEALKQLVVASLADDVRVAAKALGDTIWNVVENNVEGRTGETTAKLSSAVTVTASNAYIRAACPGPDTSAPDTTFAFGQVRFDAPGIKPNKAALEDGDVLLTFTSCVTGKVTLTGKSSAYYDTAKGMVATLKVGAVIEGIGDVALDQPLRLNKNVVQVLTETPQGTYVIDLGSLPESITVTGDGGSIRCALNGGKATCEVAGKSFTFDVRDLNTK